MVLYTLELHKLFYNKFTKNIFKSLSTVPDSNCSCLISVSHMNVAPSILIRVCVWFLSTMDKYSGTFRTESIWYLSWYFAFRKIILSNSGESLDRQGAGGGCLGVDRPGWMRIEMCRSPRKNLPFFFRSLLTGSIYACLEENPIPGRSGLFYKLTNASLEIGK